MPENNSNLPLKDNVEIHNFIQLFKDKYVGYHTFGLKIKEVKKISTSNIENGYVIDDSQAPRI